MDCGERATAGAHFGLQGVRERVDKLGGMLEIDSTPGEGTRLAVMVPLARRRAVVRRGSGWRVMADKLKIMLVDDHYLVRMGLASIIALEPDMTVCAEAATGEQALALFRTHRPDVTLMDQRLPGMTGSETTQAIRREFPDARILVLSTYVCDEEIYKALQFGAMAYLVEVRPARGTDRSAIRKAATGRRHITPRSRRCWPTACRGRTCRRASSRCCGCWSAASATGRSRRSWTSPKERSSCT